MALQIASTIFRTMRNTLKPTAIARSAHYFTPETHPPVKPPDEMTTIIQQFDDVGKLFGYISTNSHKFRESHALNALRVLFMLAKHERFGSARRAEVPRSPAFADLCRAVNRNIRALEVNDLIESLKIVLFFDISPQTTIVQKLLQLIKEQINDLNLNHIIFLDFLLLKMEKNHLSNALQVALPLAFQIQLSLEMDHNNMQHLASVLRYSSQNNVPERTVKSIINGMTLCEERVDLACAKMIVMSLCGLNIADAATHANSVRLLYNSMNVLVERIDDLSVEDLAMILQKLKWKILNGSVEFYHDVFFNACAKSVQKRRLNLERATFFAGILNRLNAPNIGLLDYVSRLCIDEASSLSTIAPRELVSIVRCFANADYKPVEWDLYSQYILDHEILDSNDVEFPWLTFGQSLATLDCFSHKLNEKIFNAKFLAKILDSDVTKVNHLQLLILAAAVKAFDTNYTGNLPPDDIMEHARHYQSEMTIDTSLHPFLTGALSGSQNYVHGVQLDNGLIADYLFAVQENGVPVPLGHQKAHQSHIVRYEDIVIPIGCEPVLLIVFPKSAIAMNSLRVKGHHNIKLKILKQNGYRAVPILAPSWQMLGEAERVDYLIREINETLPNSHRLRHHRTNI